MGRGVRELGARSRAASVLVSVLLLTGCSAGTADDSPAPTPSTAATATPATTPVQAPTPGSTTSTVPSEKVTKRKAVSLDGRGEAADDVSVTLTKVAAITAKAVGPGEVSGPALALTVAVDNGTSQPVDLGSVVVNVTASDDTPAAQMTGKPARSFAGAVEAGKTTSAVYVFALGRKKRSPVTVEVSISPTDPVVVFRGRAAS